MQVTLDAIGISMKALVHVMNLFLITFVIFTLAGVSLYQTSFQRRCVLPQGAPLVCCECVRGKCLGIQGILASSQSHQQHTMVAAMLGPGTNSEFTYAEPPWYCGSTNPLSHKDKVTLQRSR
jgi:hypothetical protein